LPSEFLDARTLSLPQAQARRSPAGEFQPFRNRQIRIPPARNDKLKSVASKAELNRLKAAARATAIKDRRVNIRLSSGDLQDIQAKAPARRSTRGDA
jgi:hypothetical protein